MRRRHLMQTFPPIAAIFIASIGFAACTWAQQIEPPSRETTAEPTFGFPEQVFPEAARNHFLFQVENVIVLIAGFGVFAAGGYFLFKYAHKPGRRAAFIHGNNKLEITWTLVPTIILAVLAAISQDSWSQLKKPGEPTADDIKVNVIGMQFNWYFHYPGTDGEFGALVPEKMRPKSGDPYERVGLDTDGPGADDLIIPNNMVVPVDKRVYFSVTSIDVIHSFFLPNLWVKQDAMPGMQARGWFRADKMSEEVIGETTDFNAALKVNVYDESSGSYLQEVVTYAKPYPVVCAELCGLSHFKMGAKLYVVTEDQYDHFISGETELKHGSGDNSGDEDSGEEEDPGY